MYNFYRLTKRFKHCFNPSNRSNLKYNRRIFQLSRE